VPEILVNEVFLARLGETEWNRALIARSGVARPLFVSHEMIGRMLLRNLLDLQPLEALTYGHPHEVIYRVDPAARTLDEIRA
jgi:broad specificity phosphatase PhoE